MTASGADMPLVIAEAGVNHNGDRQRALEMIAAAKSAGADVIKFQAFSPAALVAAGTGTAAYQRANTGEGDQRAMLERLALSEEDFSALAERCRAQQIEFLCTAFDIEMVERLVAMGMKRIKVASGELTNTPALRRFGALRLPVLLSTGMATLAEVAAAVEMLRGSGARDITLLHCTSLYPAPNETINLRAMATMAEQIVLPVGYSDHSLGDHVAIAAVALGATVVEKHFTMDRALPGPDHRASLEPAELKTFIDRLRATARALGDGIKRPAPGEIETAALVRRSWHAVRDLAAGSELRAADVALKRPAHGLPPDQAPFGRTLRRPRRADEPIRADDLA
jgi:N-acetylneuraminate synthase/N,N'-diacetyllegionaminate synthase